MEKKGFVLVDILVGLFIMGLVTVVSLPLLTSTYLNYSRINTITEMNYLGESIYERLVAKDDYSKDLINELVGQDEVIFYDLNSNHLEKYESKVTKLSDSENLLEIKIIIKSNSHGGNISDVEFKGTILK